MHFELGGRPLGDGEAPGPVNQAAGVTHDEYAFGHVHFRVRHFLVTVCRLDDGAQLQLVDRLGQIAIAAGHRAADLVEGLVLAGEHDHLHERVVLVLLDHLADVVAVHAGQHHVEEDHVEMLFGDLEQRLFARGGELGRDAVRLQLVLQERAHQRAVVHREHAELVFFVARRRHGTADRRRAARPERAAACGCVAIGGSGGDRRARRRHHRVQLRRCVRRCAPRRAARPPAATDSAPRAGWRASGGRARPRRTAPTATAA